MLTTEAKVKELIDARLAELTGDIDKKVDEFLRKYTQELVRAGSIITEPEDLITSPGTPYVIFQHMPRTPTLVGGYIDLAGMSAEDTFEVTVELKMRPDWKWRVFSKETYNSFQVEPLLFFRDIFVVGGIKITLHQTTGIGKHIYSCWYKRK